MNQMYFFVCTGKFKSWLHFWVHICVKSWRKWIWLVLAVLQFWFMSWYESFRILTGCPSRNAQQESLIFPLHTKSHIWFISGWRPDAYRLGLTNFDSTFYYSLTKSVGNICVVISVYNYWSDVCTKGEGWSIRGNIVQTIKFWSLHQEGGGGQKSRKYANVIYERFLILISIAIQGKHFKF